MKYFDKFGLEITADLWNGFIRNRHYVIIEYHCYGRVTIDTQWVGIQSHLCKRPTLFSTKVTIGDEACWVWHDDKMRIKDVREFHFDSCRFNRIPLPRKR